MMVVQANPKTQPGGVQGALFKLIYQSVCGPLFINQLPMASPPKLINRNETKNLDLDRLVAFNRFYFLENLISF